jgi:hypothetical protein
MEKQSMKATQLPNRFGQSLRLDDIMRDLLNNETRKRYSPPPGAVSRGRSS